MLDRWNIVVSVAAIALSLAAGEPSHANGCPSDIFVADFDAGFFFVDPVTGNATPLDTGGAPAEPGNLALESASDVLVVDGVAQTLTRVDTLTGNTDPVSSGGLLLFPLDLDVGPSGEIFVADGGNPLSLDFGSIVEVDPLNGSQEICFEDLVNFVFPFGLMAEASGSTLLTAQVFTGMTLEARLQRVSCGGPVDVLTTDGFLSQPSGVAKDSTGAIFMLDMGAKLIRFDESTGMQTLLHAGLPLVTPLAVAVDPCDDSLIIADSGASAIFRYESSSGITTIASGAPFITPNGVVTLPEPGGVLGLGAGALLLRVLSRRRSRA